jgi:hypothetical protein
MSVPERITKRRASCLEDNRPSKRPKKGVGKLHQFSKQEIDGISQLLASDWTKDEIVDYFFWLSDIRRSETLNMCNSKFGTTEVNNLARAPNFIPTGKDELKKAQIEWNKKQNTNEIVVHPNTLTDEELMKTHEVINRKRPSLAFKPMVAYKDNILRIFWLKMDKIGVVEVKSSVAMDSKNSTSEITIVANIFYDKKDIDLVKRNFLAEGWEIAPFEYYMTKQEKVGLHLPFKIILPKNDTELGECFKSTDKVCWFDFQISLNDDIQPVRDSEGRNRQGYFG